MSEDLITMKHEDIRSGGASREPLVYIKDGPAAVEALHKRIDVLEARISKMVDVIDLLVQTVTGLQATQNRTIERMLKVME